MKIHHYTDINTLALILKTRKLLFKRLDCVDDLEEGNIKPDGLKLGQYVFVSCWTEASEESIPLWKMYSDGKMGVRITMDQDMFLDHVVSDLILPNGLHSRGVMTSKIPSAEFVNQDYFILPLFDLKNDMFYRKVKYVDDVYQMTRDIVDRKMTDEIHGNIQISFGEIGRYKNKRWAFQEESRFSIIILPTNPLYDSNPDTVSSTVTALLYANKELGFSSYFLDLKPEALNSMVITLNPSAEIAQQIITESLCKQYAPGAIVKESSLKHGVKLK